MTSLTFNIAKRRKISGQLQAFAEPDSDTAPAPLSESEKQQNARSLQDDGNRHAEAGQYSAAIRLYDRALELQPGSAVLHELKAQVFLAAEQPWPALQSASAATRLDPSWAEGFLTLGRAQWNFGEPEEALESMKEVLRLQPDNQSALEDIIDIRKQVQRRVQNPVPLRAQTVHPG